jgi:universal stress protein E
MEPAAFRGVRRHFAPLEEPMTYPIRTVVAGVAELDANDPVLHHALELVERLGAVCHLVHAYLPPAEPLGLPSADVAGIAAPALAPEALGSGEVEQALRARLEDLVPSTGLGARLRVHVVAGSAHDALTRTAEETRADLILVGATRRGLLGEAILGTTASHTLHAARVPVLVLRETPRQPGTRVLLTTDLSELSAQACALAIEASRTLFGDSATFRCLLAVGGGGGDLPPVDTDEVRASADERLHHFLDRVAGSGPRVAGIVRVGDPPDEIVAEAADWPADVLALGTHGRSGVSRLFMGSVAEAALRNARCTALVVPAAMFRGSSHSE